MNMTVENKKSEFVSAVMIAVGLLSCVTPVGAVNSEDARQIGEQSFGYEALRDFKRGNPVADVPAVAATKPGKPRAMSVSEYEALVQRVWKFMPESKLKHYAETGSTGELISGRSGKSTECRVNIGFDETEGRRDHPEIFIMLQDLAGGYSYGWGLGYFAGGVSIKPVPLVVIPGDDPYIDKYLEITMLEDRITIVERAGGLIFSSKVTTTFYLHEDGSLKRSETTRQRPWGVKYYNSTCLYRRK